MQIIDSNTLELFNKAANGCIESQYDLVLHYLNLDEPDCDPQIISYYLDKLLSIPYHSVRIKELIHKENYLDLLLLCGNNFALCGKYKIAIQYYNRTKEFADKYISKEYSEHLFEELEYHDIKLILESYISDGYETYDTNLFLKS